MQNDIEVTVENQYTNLGKILLEVIQQGKAGVSFSYKMLQEFKSEKEMRSFISQNQVNL